MSNTLPMLSSEGWVKNPATQMVKLYNHAFLSDHSQSNIYAGSIMSMQHILANEFTNKIELVTAIEENLERYYRSYFDEANVVFKLDNDTTDSAVLSFSLQITAQKDGKRYDLAKELSVDTTSPTLRFIEAINR